MAFRYRSVFTLRAQSSANCKQLSATLLPINVRSATHLLRNFHQHQLFPLRPRLPFLRSEPAPASASSNSHRNGSIRSMSDNKPVGHFNVPGDEAAVARTTASAPCQQPSPPPPEAEPDAIDKIRSFFEARFRLSGRAADDASDTESCDGKATSAERFECRVNKCERRLAARVLKEVDLEHLVAHWRAGGFKRIVTMVGAGISTSAGIPDFRSPSTGLYHNLRKYNLPHPTAIFDIDYFLRKPQPFFRLARELYPGQFRPTPCHYFVRLLHERRLLQRHYTQNIDTLERIAGLPAERLVEAHGTFHTNHCVQCRRAYPQAWMKRRIMATCGKQQVPRCAGCGALVKPDIVFFGENLPQRFYELPERDLGAECDLLIVMGTSLEVHPFAGLVDMVGERCVRLLINREAVGVDGGRGEGFQFGRAHNQRDVFWQGDCDAGVWWLADQLGWRGELEALIERETARLEGEGQEEDGEEADALGDGEDGGEEAETCGDEEALTCGEGCGETGGDETVAVGTITTGDYSGSATADGQEAGAGNSGEGRPSTEPTVTS